MSIQDKQKLKRHAIFLRASHFSPASRPGVAIKAQCLYFKNSFAGSYKKLTAQIKRQPADTPFEILYFIIKKNYKDEKSLRIGTRRSRLLSSSVLSGRELYQRYGKTGLRSEKAKLSRDKLNLLIDKRGRRPT